MRMELLSCWFGSDLAVGLGARGNWKHRGLMGAGQGTFGAMDSGGGPFDPSQLVLALGWVAREAGPPGRVVIGTPNCGS